MENNETDFDKFYTDAKDYWSEVPATVDGMLGGYGHISKIDIQGSRQFLKMLFSRNSDKPGNERALDCGAGIGRITKELLTYHFTTVDLLEQNIAFLEQAKIYLQPVISKIGEFIPIGLQSFQPTQNKYDIIWIQWVLGHLTDEDLSNFLQNCKLSLKENGAIIIKENITSTGEVEVDKQDSSVTRPYKLLMEIFEKADLDCFKKLKQAHFPKEIYTVYMFALRPRLFKKEKSENLECKSI